MPKPLSALVTQHVNVVKALGHKQTKLTGTLVFQGTKEQGPTSYQLGRMKLGEEVQRTAIEYFARRVIRLCGSCKPGQDLDQLVEDLTRELIGVRDLPEPPTIRPCTPEYYRTIVARSKWIAEITQHGGVTLTGSSFEGETGKYNVELREKSGRLKGRAIGFSGNADGENFGLVCICDGAGFMEIMGEREGLQTHRFLGLVLMSKDQQLMMGGYTVYELKHDAITTGVLELRREHVTDDSLTTGK